MKTHTYLNKNDKSIYKFIYYVLKNYIVYY